jgi:hypothetical protein
MKSNQRNVPDTVREYLFKRGYRQFQVEYPDFGGMILYLPREGGKPEAAYYISRPSTTELVTSDELRRVLDFLEGSGIALHHALTTSRFSEGSRTLATKYGINLKEQLTPCVEILQPVEEDTHITRKPFHPAASFVNGSPVNQSDM